jgi:hypothetical protein
MSVKVKRLLDAPIICPHMDDRMGDNINGPSIIRVPDWVENPLGRYYLYFADHMGRYIRMAYADAVLGPWKMYFPGVLDVEDSLFVPTVPPELPYSERPDWALGLEGGYLYAHIASPDVHVDDKNTQIRMYYHGLLPNGDQQTRIAYSDDGLAFTPRSPLLGPPYFRAFTFESHVYAISWAGVFLRSSSWDGPFEVGPTLPDIKSSDEPKRSIRHAEVYIKGEILHIFFSCIDDCPERFFQSQIVLSPDWQNWKASEPKLVLVPELDWEGADIPLVRSKIGASHSRQRSLRDPCVFEDEGKTYLLYCGAAENGGIGIAELHF